jgi:DNA-binding MarR family transcriptional regulator
MTVSLDSQDSLDGGVVGAVSALIRAEHRHAAFLAHKLELPPADTLALYHLANEALSASALGDRLGLTSGSVTTLVDRLVARKLARRRPNPTDRRGVLVELTKSGHATSWKVLQHFIGDVVSAAMALAPNEQVIVERFLTTLTNAIDTDTARMQSH